MSTQNYTLAPNDLHELRGLIGAKVAQLVWDINAVYFVLPHLVIKAEIGFKTVGQKGGRYFEDIHPIEVAAVNPPPTFREEGEARHAYWVVATDEPISQIDIVRVAIRMPDWEVISPLPGIKDQKDIYLLDGGLLIHTPVGVLSAVPHFPGYGFRYESQGSGPRIELVDLASALAILPDNCELITIA